MMAYLLGCSRSGAKADPTQDFLNPLKDPWPKAPSMRIYCMYGVGSAAERNYHYHHLDSTKVGVSSSRNNCDLPKRVQIPSPRLSKGGHW